ncbi:hypothetical protein Pcinc_022625 [Petrolisthes cinctipes]|uniref:Uncharacterized protein n=1 Tax=Petrolisthes cinctipes TaxID=88211 RepID=A0AAE1FDU8_PETCI|nr:hypothetical protein Pcinc_028319 [Petrolisthes cinctipes]KAK3872292.1 hypothetical protein Pcinc_022625 [Petrolisthes cinctipes]
MEGHNTHGDVGQPQDPSGGRPPSSQPVLTTPALQKCYDPLRGYPAVLTNTPQSATNTPTYSDISDMIVAIYSIDGRKRKVGALLEVHPAPKPTPGCGW